MQTFASRILLTLAVAICAVTAQQLDVGATVPPGLATAAPIVAAVPPQAAAASAGTQAPVDDGWSGCVNPRLSEEENLVRIGKPTSICIVLGSATKWNDDRGPPVRYLRLSFRPNADLYSRFHVPSSYQDLINQNALPALSNGANNVTIHVSSQKILSFQRIFYTPNSGAGRVYPYLTAIIDVQKGVVKGITWDDSCLFCSDEKCLENTYDYNGNLGTQKEYGQPTKGCYVDQKPCDAAMVASAGNKDAKPICDVSVYFVWTGDDADGKALQSSAFRFSAFPEQEIKNRITDNLPDIGSLWGGDDEENGQ